MKRRMRLAAAVIVFTYVCSLVYPGGAVYASDGANGFDGAGISSGETAGRDAVDFQEYTFITGSPVLLKGSLVVTRSDRAGNMTSVYAYRLSNAARNIQLTREISYTTVSTLKDGGQTVTETSLAREPSEKIVVGAQTYTLRRMDFSRTSLIDAKPAVSYYSGNTWYRKQYEAGGGGVTSASGNIMTVEATGQYYGFDQAWGSAYVEDTQYMLEYTQSASGAGDGAARELWSGTADVKRSQTVITELRYVENEPQAISFRGGFLETRRSDGVLEYNARLPEFDSSGMAMERLRRYTDSAQVTTFPSIKRLVSPDLRQIRAHWAEESVSKLYGLEIYKTRPSEFSPDQYITRGKFAAALSAAAPPVPEDQSVRRGRAARPRGRAAAAPAPSFNDVPAGHEYFSQIEDVYARGIMFPIDKNEFAPNQKVRVADAAVAFVRALGLEAVASGHGAVTEFADDAGIPEYARDALYVAQKIGLLRGDERGNINPLKEVTDAEAAVMIVRFVEYMMKDLKLDYRDYIINF